MLSQYPAGVSLVMCSKGVKRETQRERGETVLEIKQHLSDMVQGGNMINDERDVLREFRGGNISLGEKQQMWVLYAQLKP